MTIRRLPLHPDRRQARQNQSMIPGTLGGRLASAAAVRAHTRLQAFERVNAAGTPIVSAVLGKRDTWTLPSSGAQSLTLSYTPLQDTLHLYRINRSSFIAPGPYLEEGVDYTLAGGVVSLLSGMSPAAGDHIEGRYLYYAGAPNPPTSAAAITPVGNSSAVGGTLTLPSGIQTGDLILFGAMGGSGTPSTSVSQTWGTAASGAPLSYFDTVYWAIANAPLSGSGTVSGATAVQCRVYRGANATSPIQGIGNHSRIDTGNYIPAAGDAAASVTGPAMVTWWSFGDTNDSFTGFTFGSLVVGGGNPVPGHYETVMVLSGAGANRWGIQGADVYSASNLSIANQYQTSTSVTTYRADFCVVLQP